METAAPGAYLASYVDQSSRPRLICGQVGTVQLRLRNVGQATWRRDDPGPVVLATDRPLDRPGRTYLPGVWLSPNRICRVDQPLVAPGAIGSFTLHLRAPNVPGRAVEHVRPVADGLAWFNDLELFVVVDALHPSECVPPNFAATIESSTPRLLLRAGDRAMVSLRATNAGAVRWTDRGGDEGPLVQVGTMEPLDHPGIFHTPDNWIGPTRPTRVRGIVLPGETTEFTFTITAPPEPGLYVEAYKLVAEGVSWFPEGSFAIEALVV